jgi:hypothetical protein
MGKEHITPAISKIIGSNKKINSDIIVLCSSNEGN